MHDSKLKAVAQHMVLVHFTNFSEEQSLLLISAWRGRGGGAGGVFSLVHVSLGRRDAKKWAKRADVIWSYAQESEAGQVTVTATGV